MTEDKPPSIGDIVDLNIPGAELTGKVTGVLIRVDHTEYEVLWNDGSTTYAQAWDIKEHNPHETILDK